MQETIIHVAEEEESGMGFQVQWSDELRPEQQAGCG